MFIGDEISIEPAELVAGGAALARVDGFPVFATNVYPGDAAVVRIVEVKKGFARGELVRLVRASPLRRVLPCPIAEECGGCDWTSLRLDAQLTAKRRILSESLRRIGKFDVDSLPQIALHPSPLNYRIRSRLHREGDAVGFFAMRSNRVVPLVEECEVVGVETARAFGNGGQAIVPVRNDDGRGQAGLPVLQSSEVWEVGGALIRDEEALSIRVGEFVYHLSTEAFFQVNRHLLGTMLRLVSEHAARVRSPRVAIDLYGGVGFFTLPLAKRFERVLSVEGSLVSHRYARLNAPANVEPVHAAVESWVRRMPPADLVFLDPPRAGARREVIDAAGEKARERVVYLSCDPVTFSRDAGRLTAAGWRLATLDLLDLFPNTHHVETLASFERAS